MVLPSRRDMDHGGGERPLLPSHMGDAEDLGSVYLMPDSSRAQSWVKLRMMALGRG